MRFRAIVALAAFTALAAGLLPLGAARAGTPSGPATPNLAGCDDRDPAACLLPFPNDRFTVADPTTPTGRRINFSPLAMPRNVAGKPIDPTEWNRNDGFSPGSMILTVVPGVDLGKTGAAPVTDVGRSLHKDQP